MLYEAGGTKVNAEVVSVFDGESSQEIRLRRRGQPLSSSLSLNSIDPLFVYEATREIFNQEETFMHRCYSFRMEAYKYTRLADFLGWIKYCNKEVTLYDKYI